MNEITQAQTTGMIPSLEHIPLEELPTHIRVCEQNIRVNGWMLGALLIEAKGRCKHGEFGDWLTQNTDISHSTANDLMKLAQGVQETPFLQTINQSAAIALLALPAEEREQFAEEHDAENASVRELKKAIKEITEQRQAAEQRAEEAAKEAEKAKTYLDRTNGNYEKLLDKVQQMEAQGNEKQARIVQLEQTLSEATKPEAISVPVEVEKIVQVMPDDYEDLKRKAEAHDADVEAAQQYAIEMEQKAKAAQAELRKIRDRAQQEGETSSYDISAFQGTISEFMGRVALFPKMASNLSGMDHQTAFAYARCIDLVSEWCDESRQMLEQIENTVDEDAFHVI